MKLDVDNVMKYQETDEYYMRLALKEAKKSLEHDDIPCGAIIVQNGIIISKGHNTRHKNQNVLGHAEIEAIKKANKKLNTWILDDCTLYCTIEPCVMCSSIIVQSRIKRVVYATREEKYGACGSRINLLQNSDLNTHIEITKGILEEESQKLLKNFFQKLRQNK